MEELSEPQDNQGNIITDHQRTLTIWQKYIQDLYDSENHPKDIVIETEEELDEDNKGLTILKGPSINYVTRIS